jgi:hypothetical protein
MMCPAVCTLTMAAALADAACLVVTVNSAGSGRWRLPRAEDPRRNQSVFCGE